MTPEVRTQLGAQRAMVKHLLVYEMRKRGHTASSLARELGCSNANVSKVLCGHSHSELVLDALWALGVPEEYLFDPRRVDAARGNLQQQEGGVMAIACTFRMNDASQAHIATIYAEAQRLIDVAATLPRSEAELLQPLLESLLSILTNLSDCLVTVEGDVEFETTGTRED